MLVHDLIRRSGFDLVAWAGQRPTAGGVAAGITVGCLVFFGGAPSNPFIYFQF